MSASLGKLFTITIFGESHGPAVGVVIDGCPAGLKISSEDIQTEVNLRHPQGAFYTPRHELDRIEILSGLFQGHTTGSPICIIVHNKDVDSTEYERLRYLPRPGHGDYTSYLKQGGFNDYRGGGQLSGRITVAWVIAGAIAKALLKFVGIEVLVYTAEIGGIAATVSSYDTVRQRTWQDPLRCPDPKASELMSNALQVAAAEGDSLGGVVATIALGVPPGLGEPIMDTVEGELAKAFLAIPAVKGVEFGSGFASARQKGSEHNDAFVVKQGHIETLTNNAGGVLGGITTGMPLLARVAIKPTPSITKEQKTVNLLSLSEEPITVTGRHDTCIVPRAVPAVGAAMAIILADLVLRANAMPQVLR